MGATESLRAEGSSGLDAFIFDVTKKEHIQSAVERVDAMWAPMHWHGTQLLAHCEERLGKPDCATRRLLSLLQDTPPPRGPQGEVSRPTRVPLSLTDRRERGSPSPPLYKILFFWPKKENRLHYIIQRIIRRKGNHSQKSSFSTC